MRPGELILKCSNTYVVQCCRTRSLFIFYLCRVWWYTTRGSVVVILYTHCDMDQTQEEGAPHSGVCSSF